jgi:hypothetical protein
MRKVLVVALLVAVAAGCGGGDDGGGTDGSDEGSAEGPGLSLDDWADEADEICLQAQEDLSDLEIETSSQLAERGDEVLEIADDAAQAVAELEAPSDSTDQPPALDLIQALGELVELQEEVLEEIGGGEDELALLEITLEERDVLDDGVEAAEGVGADDCRSTFADRQDDLDQIEEVFDEAGDLGAVRVGDCLRGLEDGDLRTADCDDSGAEGEVVETELGSTGGCPDELVGRGGGGVFFCLQLLIEPADEDGLLQFGSCIQLEEAGGDQLDVTEQPCGNETVTHVVVDSVRRAQECEPDDRRFSKSAEEVADTGPGEWCARPAA